VTASTEKTSCPVGSALVSSFVNVVATTALVTSISGEAPVTVMASETAPTSIARFKVDVKPAVSWMPSRTTLLKPGISSFSA
jgi:hypothetical protein